jgi:hypothetical protein
LVYFLAFLAGDAAVVLLVLPVFAAFTVLGFAAFTDFGDFFGVTTFFGAVFLTAAGFLAGEAAAGFLAGEAVFSSTFLVVAAAGALRFPAVLVALAGFVSAFEALTDFGASAGLAAAAVREGDLGTDVPLNVFFKRPAGFFATLVALGASLSFTSLIDATGLGALVGFLSSSESLKEFLTL